MDICPTSQFICSLKYPETRLRTLHNLICDPETFLCDKHIAIMTGDIDSLDYLFYAPVTYRGATMLREAVACAEDRDFCDISILDDEIIFSGLSTGSCCLAMESMPDGVKLSEAIYTYSHSRLIKGFKRFKSRLKQADISHNNLSLNNIFIDIDDDWYTICNYSIQPGYGKDKASFMAIEKSINSYALPDSPSAKSKAQHLLHSITTDGDGNTIYPIVESRRRFTSCNGVGFKDKNGDVVIKDDYIWASDFSCNRAVVQLKNSKMGIIDRNGRYVIEPIYRSIVYNPNDGISIVHDGELQTKFNYLGEQIEEWHK